MTEIRILNDVTSSSCIKYPQGSPGRFWTARVRRTGASRDKHLLLCPFQTGIQKFFTHLCCNCQVSSTIKGESAENFQMTLLNFRVRYCDVYIFNIRIKNGKWALCDKMLNSLCFMLCRLYANQRMPRLPYWSLCLRYGVSTSSSWWWSLTSFLRHRL